MQANTIMGKFMTIFKTVGLASLLMASSAANAQTFEPIKEPQCLSNSNLFTMGGQYLETNSNGVLQDSYSMLVRWQGRSFTNHPVYYDLGRYTGFHNAWFQKGRQPENEASGTPGVQLGCTDAGLLINTWATPHRPVVGGGLNTMWGYAWSKSQQVRPFTKYGQPTDLVLQANIAVPWFAPRHVSGTNTVISAQVDFYAYLRDTTHPDLHPIVILAATHGNDPAAGTTNGFVSFDYSDAMTREAVALYPLWFTAPEAGQGAGVWFAGGPIRAGSASPYVTTVYSQGQLTKPLTPQGTPMEFWRAHVTPQNLINSINTIEATGCYKDGFKGVLYDCPARGYSKNPADYALEYAGVIAEVALLDNRFDMSDRWWTVGDSNKDQVSLGVHVQGFGVYRYVR